MLTKMTKIIAKFSNRIIKMVNRKRLKVDDFSIICNCCIGGVIYHKLGKQFLSPTINLDIEDVDFYKMVHNLKEYMAEDLVFIESDAKFPVAYCGDVRINFIHYHSNEEAAQKWYERRERINYEKLYLIASDRPYRDHLVTNEMIESLKDIPCKGRVVFTNRQIAGCDYTLALPKDADGDYVNIYMLDKTTILKRWRWETLFDYVNWLNTGKVK